MSMSIPEADIPAGRKWVVTGCVMVATLMVSLDSSIVNVAMPRMRGNLGASVEEITWVATAYILANVVVMPAIAFLAERFGRRNVYAGGIAVFTASSLLCGLAWDLPSMVLFRILQGLGGGVLVPMAQAILRETFPPREQGMAMGIFGMGVILGPAVGPTLGGWITDNYSWPWIFYINIPIGLAVLPAVWRLIEDPPFARRAGRADLLGLSLMTVGLGALQLLLEKGQEHNWFDSAFIVQLAAISFMALFLFVWRELTIDYPAVDLRVLRDVNLATGTLLGALLGVVLFGTLFLLPLFLQQLLGYSALDSGLTLLPRSLTMALAMPLTGRLYNRIGPHIFITVALVVLALSFMELARLTADVGYWDFFWPQVAQGVAFAMIFVSLSTVAFSTVERSRITAAAGLNNVVRQVFGSVGIALSATELTSASAVYRVHLVAHLSVTNDWTTAWLDGAAASLVRQGIDPTSAPGLALHLLDGMVNREAAVMAYNHVFFLMGGIFLAALPLVLLLRHAEGHSPHISSAE